MTKVQRNQECPCGSGKKYKHCCLRKDRQEAIDRDREIREIFLGEGEEPLTDELIEKLVAKGWSRDELKEHQEAGARYSRPRNSILYPAEFDGKWFD